MIIYISYNVILGSDLTSLYKTIKQFYYFASKVL